MENSKLEKIAIKLSKLFNDNKNMLYYSNRFFEIRKNHLDYFNHFSIEDIIKLLFLISSLKRTHSLEFGWKLIQNFEFFAFFVVTGGHLEEECDYCNGGGNIQCEPCDGSGKISCDTCDGSGDMECPNCNGSGCDDCDDEGLVDCDDCDSTGEYDCNVCGGGGYDLCGECDGSGQLEDYDKKEYINYYVVCWDKKLNKIARDFSELNNPFMLSDDFFEKYSDKFLVFYRDTGFDEIEDLDDDKIYFYNVSDVPINLSFSYDRFYYSGEPTDYFN